MKVGILTFHRAENFGAMLQVFALQQYLRKLKHDVDIIDYRNKTIESMYHIYNPYILVTRKNVFKSVEIYLSRFKNIQDRKVCKVKYSEFRSKYLNISAKCNTIDAVKKNYDCIIVGSDQVWNLHLTGGLDKNYFLDYVKEPGMKKISYAASSELDPYELLSIYGDELSRMLDDFDRLSVREEFLKENLSNYTKNEIKVCFDPTFLLTVHDYKGLSSQLMDEKYILVYHMTPIPEGVVLADRIACVNNWKVVEIHMGYGYNNGGERHKVNLGPLEILSYISNAKEVITSSFHGLALSLIMQKNVWVIDKGNNLRQRNLLNSLNLNDRMVSSINDFNYKTIDYVCVNSLLEKQINESKEFIHNALIAN